MAFRLRCAPGACFIFAALLQSPTGAAQPVATAPLTLERAVAAALLGNPELRSFEFQIHAQDARTRQAGLRPATELTLELENALGTGEYRGAESVEATLALSQLIELGGKREARIAAANAGRGVLDVERQARQLDVLADALVEGHYWEMRNFGVFKLKQRSRRMGRNIHTGEKVPVPSYRDVVFKPGKVMLERVAKAPLVVRPKLRKG